MPAWLFAVSLGIVCLPLALVLIGRPRTVVRTAADLLPAPEFQPATKLLAMAAPLPAVVSLPTAAPVRVELPRPTPTNLPTPTSVTPPTPTPAPVAAVLLLPTATPEAASCWEASTGFRASFALLLNEWLDMRDLVLGAPRIALAPGVQELQRIRGLIESLSPPPCARQMHLAALDSMAATLYAMQQALARPGAVLPRDELEQAQRAMQAIVQSINAVGRVRNQPPPLTVDEARARLPDLAWQEYTAPYGATGLLGLGASLGTRAAPQIGLVQRDGIVLQVWIGVNLVRPEEYFHVWEVMSDDALALLPDWPELELVLAGYGRARPANAGSPPAWYFSGTRAIALSHTAVFGAERAYVRIYTP
jgi:hypothetical protein